MRKRLFAASVLVSLLLSVFSVTANAEESDYYEVSDYTISGENYEDPEDISIDSELLIDEESETSSEPETSEPEKKEGVAYPVHDFNYSASDMEMSLLSGDYYYGYDENAYFKDEAKVFDDEKYYTEIENLIQRTADETGLNIGVFLGGLYRNDSATETFTVNAIKSLFSMDWDQNSVFLYLDFEGKSISYDYICTCHDAKLYYPDSGMNDRVEEMIQHMYRYLPSSGNTIYKTKVKDAIDAFTSDLKKYKNKGPVWDSCYHNDEKDCYRYVLFGTIIDQPFRPFKYWYAFLGIGLVIGLLIGTLSNKSIRKKYKFRDPQKASVYTSNNLIHFNEVRDQFLTEHTTRTYIPPSDSSSGGGGGGGGGGGSFGGGGGHR